MVGRDDRRDLRLEAARYQVDRLTREADDAVEEPSAKTPTLEQHAAYVEVSIEQAIRRGDFDDLPGAGKPLSGLQQSYDPDWWIRRKIETERLTGLGPPALTLRTESSRLHETLDATGSERAVRELLEDFNKRVIEARRQLQGGPPVVTPTRDIDEELARWRERRVARYRAAALEAERAAEEEAAMTWRERRRAKRRR